MTSNPWVDLEKHVSIPSMLQDRADRTLAGELFPLIVVINGEPSVKHRIMEAVWFPKIDSQKCVSGS